MFIFLRKRREGQRDGQLVESPASGQGVEVQAAKIDIYGTADPETYPLQKKGHSLEFLRDIAYLRPRTNTFGAVLRIRHAMAFAIHKYFNDNGFYYLHTPLITGSDCEGAGAMFNVTTLDIANPPRTEDGKVDYTQDFFGKHTSLTVSGHSEDGIIEVVEDRTHPFFIGVQWHPEYMSVSDEPSRKLFAAFVDACRK